MELEQILSEVAAGRLNVNEAAVRIRQLFARPRPGGARGLRRPGGPSPLAALIFAAVGSICIVVAVVVGLGTFNFAADAARTEGVVVRLAAGRDHKSGQAPVVRFEVDGESYEFQSSVASNPPAHPVGQKVQILYNPNNPREAQIDSFLDRWLLPLIFGLVGLVLSAVGFGMMIALLRRPILPLPVPAPPKPLMTDAPPRDRPPVS